ncbi:cellobiohydrolase precursor [Xylariales sp. PMI_506]|nr:cellobiohydrolase precursor [Xylariales sp. PMI_506]
MQKYAITLSGLVAVAYGQSACTLTEETHPSLTWEKCDSDGTCTAVDGSVVVDANWRWTHEVSGSTNCYTGNEWDTSICDSDEACATACCVDGADYESTYGVTTSGSALTLDFVTQSEDTNVGSRLYLLSSETEYETFTLLGNEFTFDVDVSQLPCGLNGALYFVSMDADGGMAKYSGNTAGAKYGTGYCDSQCARDLKFINGQANMEGWTPSTVDSNSGVGDHGSCCPEMDIWEANSVSNALTPHPCTNITQHMCTTDDCGGTYSTDRYAGDCDPDGCDFNPYRMGDTTFYGPDMNIDTTANFTVVTQFIAGSDGTLETIARYYVQNGAVISNANSSISGVSGNEITTDFCTAQKEAFGDTDSFTAQGGLSQMSLALAQPMVLVMSLWADDYSDMLWLDSTYPANKTTAGGPRGTCATDSGVPSTLVSDSPGSKVIYSNIKFGPIGSTFNSAGTSSSSSSSSSSDSSSSSSSSSSSAAAAAAASTSSVSAAAAAAAATTTESASIVATSIAVESVSTVSEAIAAASTTSGAAAATSASSCKKKRAEAAELA